ncbi:hypothetical protein H0H92_012401 [Tricholoma furcatifolium]|nr:hypothetical protein H0H92_012401 [Tricholoma furcatifolium]
MGRDNDRPDADPEIAREQGARVEQVAHAQDASTDRRGVGAHRPAPLRPDSSKLHFELTAPEVESTSDEDRDHSYGQMLQRRVDAFWSRHPEVSKQSTRDRLYGRVRRTLHIMQATAPASLPTEADKMINLVETYLGRECQEYFSRKAARGSQISSVLSTPAVGGANELAMPSPITMALTNLSQPWQPGESNVEFNNRQAAAERQRRVSTGGIQMPYQPTTAGGSSVTGPAAASTPPVGKWKDRTILQKVRLEDLKVDGRSDIQDQGVIFVQGVAYDTLHPSVSQVRVKEEPSSHSRVPQAQEYKGIPGFEPKAQPVVNGNRDGGRDRP